MNTIVSLLKELDNLSKSAPYTMELYSTGHCELLDGDGLFVLSARTIQDFEKALEREVQGFRYNLGLDGSRLPDEK